MNNPSRVAFTLFGRDVYWRGVHHGPGHLDSGMAHAQGRQAQKRPTEDDILDMCLVIIPSGVVGARLYYVIFEWASYASNPIRALYIWEGGLAIYGAVIGGLLGMFIYSKVRKIRFLKLGGLHSPRSGAGSGHRPLGKLFQPGSLRPSHKQWRAYVVPLCGVYRGIPYIQRPALLQPLPHGNVFL